MNTETSTETFVPEHIQAQIDDAQSYLLPITPEMPWSELEEPIAYSAQTRQLSVSPLVKEDKPTGELNLFRSVQTGEDGPITQELLGLAGSTFMQQFAWALKFPKEFVEKLSPEIKSLVINDRIMKAEPQSNQIVVHEGVVANITPGWRNMAPFSQIAQAVYNATLNTDTELTIDKFEWNGSGLRMDIMTNRREVITPKLGDELQFGIRLIYLPGNDIEVSLLNRRLVCLNGMTSVEAQYSWKERGTRTIEDQIQFVGNAAVSAMDRIEAFVVRAQTMASTAIEGNIADLIRERARAMGIAVRHVPAIIAAWELEPDMTEWGIVNAFTRFGTHDQNIGRTVGEKIQRDAASFTNSFEMVNADLPRTVARRVGAHINAS
jgi:hypothetical protein